MSRHPDTEKNESEVKTQPKFRKPTNSLESPPKNERNIVRIVGMTSDTAMKISAGPTKIQTRADSMSFVISPELLSARPPRTLPSAANAAPTTRMVTTPIGQPPSGGALSAIRPPTSAPSRPIATVEKS